MSKKKEKRNLTEPIIEEKSQIDIIEEEPIEWKKICICVENIKNVTRLFKDTNVFIQTEFMNVIFAESEPQILTYDETVVHDFHCTLKIDSKNERCIDDLVSNPILFSLFQEEGLYDVSLLQLKRESTSEIQMGATSVDTKSNLLIKNTKSQSKSEMGKKDKNKNTDKESKKTTKKNANQEETETKHETFPFGRCTLDLLPFLLGQQHIYETLTVYQEENEEDENMVTWENLPQLTVHVWVEEPLFDEIFLKTSNVISFSVDSIYNPPSYMAPNLYYTFGTVIPLAPEKYETLLIEDGIKVEKKFDTMKKWPNLGTFKCKCVGMKCSTFNDEDLIKTELNVDVEEMIKQHVSKIEWIIMRRFWLTEKEQSNFIELLKKFRRWPIEIHASLDKTIREIDPENNTITPSAKPHVPKVKPSDLHFMGFIDITNLLYPGVTKTKIACQLRSYMYEEISENTGLTHTIFEKSTTSKPDTIKKVGSNARLSSKSSRTRKTKEGANNLDSLKSPEEPSLLVMSDDMKPTFIVLEVELEKPFYQKREIEDLIEEFKNFLPSRESLPKELINSNEASKNFNACLEEIIVTIINDYSDYVKTNEGEKGDAKDIEDDFYKHVTSESSFGKIRELLRKHVYQIATYVMPYYDKIDDDSQFDQYISKLHGYLIEEVHKKVNMMIGFHEDFKKKLSYLENNELKLHYAKEAEEIDNIEEAKRYYLERTDSDTKNALFWFDYAIFNMGQNKRDNAIYCCKQSLNLDMENKYAMLLISILFAETNKQSDAETTFRTMLSFHPEFIEGWICFNIFYLKHSIQEGADYAYECARKALKCIGEDVKDPFGNNPELSWDVGLWKPGQMYAMTAVMLIKFKTFCYAELALAQDFITIPDSTCYTYYLAVCFYLTKEYNIAIEYLQSALKIHGHDIAVGGLLGHCYYKLGQSQKAVECYEPLLYTYGRPDDIHMIYIRLGNWYRENKMYSEAVNNFLLACKYSPTPVTWMEAAITKIYMSDFLGAEKCLCESNNLDNKIPQVWEYLAMVNMKFDKKFQAEKCTQYANKLKHKSKTNMH